MTTFFVPGRENEVTLKISGAQMFFYGNEIRWKLSIFTLVWLPAVVAFAQPDFESVVCFGDSLTHNDQLGAVYGNPQDLYGDDPFQAMFNKGRQADDEIASYALAGSESRRIALQIIAYNTARLVGVQTKATLISFEIGGNDILNHRSLLAAAAPGRSAVADEVISKLIRYMRRGFADLRRDHAGAKFVMWTIPDVTKTPKLWNDLSLSAIRNLRAHTRRANRYIRRREKFPEVTVLDLWKEARNLAAEPPLVMGQPLLPPPAMGTYSALYADPIHPSAVSNALIANRIISQINDKWAVTIQSYLDAELAPLAHFE